jgi:hypothetical protein
MKHRKDITEYLVSQFGEYYKKKDYKFYEQDGLLYMAEYDYENKIQFFTHYSLLRGNNNMHIKQEIEEKFKIKFSEKGCDIFCKCGESKNFSAYYGEYNILLRCNSCDNKFSAYSG